MLEGWNSKYKVHPIIEGDFDYYKITFPKEKGFPGTITNTITNTITKVKGDGKEKEILEIIFNNPYINMVQIGKMVELSAAGVRYHLNNLKNKKRIKRVGHGKGGYWKILK